MGDGNGNGHSKADEIEELLLRVLDLVNGEGSEITEHLIRMAIVNERKRASKLRRRTCYD